MDPRKVSRGVKAGLNILLKKTSKLGRSIGGPSTSQYEETSSSSSDSCTYEYFPVKLRTPAGKTESSSEQSGSPRQRGRKHSLEGTSCLSTLSTVIRTEESLKLYNPSYLEVPVLKRSDSIVRMPLLRFTLFYYNAALIECRDMARLIDSTSGEIFCKWLDGFADIIECMFSSMEVVVYSWLKEIGSSKLANNVCLQRRVGKQQRIKQSIIDIVNLQLTENGNCEEYLKEMRRECEMLIMKIINYFKSQLLQLPAIILCSLTEDERKSFDDGMIRELSSNEKGKFVICSIERMFHDHFRNSAVGEQNHSTSSDEESEVKREGHEKDKMPTDTMSKQMKKFIESHTNLVDSVVKIPLHVDSPFEQYNIMRDDFASPSTSSEEGE